MFDAIVAKIIDVFISLDEVAQRLNGLLFLTLFATLANLI